MGIAALVLGIISFICAWIPFICWFAGITAVVGLILGIIDVVKKGKEMNKRVLGIVGLITSAIAIPIIIFMSLVSIGIAVTIVEGADTIDRDYYNSYYDDDYDYDDFYKYYNSIRRPSIDYNI